MERAEESREERERRERRETERERVKSHFVQSK